MSVDGYEIDSYSLTNPTELPGVPFYVSLFAWIDTFTNELVIEISAPDITNTYLEFSVTVSLNSVPQMPIPMELDANTYSTEHRQFAPGVTTAMITYVEVNPIYTTEGEVVQLDY